MKTKQLKEVREESVEKLTARVSELKTQVLKESIPSLGKEVKNLKAVSGLKREIAQLLTIIGEKKQTN